MRAPSTTSSPSHMQKTRKVLITGAGGLLGSQFQKISPSDFPNFEIISKNHAELDITSPVSLEQCLQELKPHFLINCAGYTNVDKAEHEQEKVKHINIQGIKILSKACAEQKIKLVDYSSDSVFDGEKKSPYLESDDTRPINFYGWTKLESERVIQKNLGEKKFLILRVTWPYGKNGKNFINYFMNHLQQFKETNQILKAVTDKIGTPNPAEWIARRTLDLLEDTSGIFHLSCRGGCTMLEFISYTLQKIQSSCTVIPILAKDLVSSAPRPSYSVLETGRNEILQKIRIPSWQEALKEYLRAEKLLPE